MFKKTGFILLAFAATLTAGEVPARDNSFSGAYPRNMTEFGEALPPIGHVHFCQARPEECQGGTNQPVLARLDAAAWQQLVLVNETVNASVQPFTDQELYNTPEHWTYPGARGDCEDYVLLKRWMLIQRGWPTEALLITVVRDQRGDGHAVLTVSTDRGDLILDNTRNEILSWSDTGYRFLKRQSRHHPAVWMSLADGGDRRMSRFLGGASN